MSAQRLAKVGYKSTAKNPAKYPSVCASIPFMEIPSDSQLLKLMPYICAMLENAQDGIIKSLYESSDGKLEAVSDDDISIDSCISYMESEAQGSRLTIELLNKWFEEQMRDNLFVVFADKLGFTDITPDVEVTIGKRLSGYKELFASLSGGKTILQPAQIKGLKQALGYAPDGDDIALKLMNRLTGMENKPTMAEMLDLG
jgi:hypothetical protein